MSEAGLRDRIEGEKLLCGSPAYDAVELTIRTPEGVERVRPAIRHRGAVVVVPLLEQPGRAPRIVLVRNERVIVGRALMECPAGGIEAGESPGEAAERELLEEAGYRAASLYPLGRFYTSPGMSDEVMHVFVASGLVHVGQSLRADEAMTVHKVATGELLGQIDSGELSDAKTMLAVLMAYRRGLLKG